MPNEVSNPLLADWSGPYGLPPFDEIETEHFRPAFAAAMEKNEAEIADIAGSAAAPTFENTVVALERAGMALDRVSRVFYTLVSAHNSPEIQAIEREIAPKLAAHFDAISANAQLYARLSAVEAAHEDGSAALEGEDLQLLTRVLRNMRKAGAHLDAAGKARNREIKLREAELSTQFSQNVLADENEWFLDLEGPEELAGLPQWLIDAAASAAKDRGRSAPYTITLGRSLVEPFLTFSERADLREKAFAAWTRRGANGNANDNRAITAEVMALRDERAKLLGYATFADYKLVGTMAATPDRVRQLLNDVWVPARKRALEEADALAEAASAEGRNGPLQASDWRYYAEQVRRARFDLDDGEIKPYFELNRVIAAAFEVAHRLFGLTFTPVDGLKLAHPDLRAWDVKDADGAHVGLFIGDYFARSAKQSGAWMSALRSQSGLDGNVRPIVLNTCNFAKASDGAPTLLSIDDARTLFHEFGHGLHGLMSQVTYPSLAGTMVSTDFVELPSQLYEHWLMSDPILSQFATHCETGEKMPAGLIEKLRAAENFNQGFKTVEYLASAIVDLELHSHAIGEDDDIVARQNAVLDEIGMPDAIVMRHAVPHFQHLFSYSHYAAAYYSYMWSEVMDADAYKAFEETGDVFNPDVAEKLKTYVYAAGGKRDESEAYMSFRGRLPTVEGLLEKRGLV